MKYEYETESGLLRVDRFRGRLRIELKVEDEIFLAPAGDIPQIVTGVCIAAGRDPVAELRQRFEDLADLFEARNTAWVAKRIRAELETP